MLRILAAFIFFTRLPFWRLAEVPSEYFKNVVSRWALVGWLTAGLSVIVLYTASLILPASVAVLLAIVTRLLITGCLHEDGLADFFDGFGGGTSRERILSIMKDSHIGSYGVIGLILYFSLLYTLLSSLPPALAGSAILAGDPFSKGVAGMIINRRSSAASDVYKRQKQNGLQPDDYRRIYMLPFLRSYSDVLAARTHLFSGRSTACSCIPFPHLSNEKENTRLYR